MGIKSFQGARKVTQQQNSNQPNFKVSDFMTKDLITFRPEQSVEDVIDSLIKHRISGGPVVNEKNELLGIISEGDCIKQISDSRYYN
ncbi:MAG: CBS domain-containing protein, partial [Olleya sp.]